VNRLHEFQFAPSGLDDYAPDAICRALTPPGFSPALQPGGDIAVRIVCTPSFAPELVVTLNRIQGVWRFDARSARVNLWAHHMAGIDPTQVHHWLAKRLLPLASWSECGACKAHEALNAAHSASEFASKWALYEGIGRIDGCGLDACWVGTEQTLEFRSPCTTTWNSTTMRFCGTLLMSVRSAIQDDDAKSLFDDVLASFGVWDCSWRRRG